VKQRIAEDDAPSIVDPGREPAYSEDGVDLSLIRWSLSRTPLERVEMAIAMANRIMEIRDANAARSAGSTEDAGPTRG
jgi:hypothetical protein